MKKIIYSVAAMALAFFAVSCQQENLEPVVKANTVTYTVQVADAVATKALGDDVTAVNELVYEVYRTAAEETTAFTSADNLLYHKTATITNGVATIELEFVNDQNFTVLFWAHVAGNGVYDADDLTAVTIETPDAANNVEAQAFVGRDFVRDCVSDANGKVTLKRAVSQLNIATTPESLVKFDDAIALNGSSVKVTGLPTAYNIAILEAFGETATEYTYTETAVPTDVLTVNGVDYTYVAMNYVGFAPEMGANVTVSYVINTSEGNIDNEIINVPVKPNYRTNIVGNLITSKTEYTITLDETWAGENIIVNNADEFTAALNRAEDGDVISLADGEYDLPASLFAQASSGTFTFEGNGVDTEVNGARNSNANAPGVYANGKHLVFKDLTYVTPNNGYNGGFGHAASVTFINCTIVGQFYAHSGAPHYFYDCTIDPLTGYLYTYGSDCVFEGCTFSASEGKALQVYQDGATGETTVTIKDCDFVAAKQAATWDGKPVTGIDINSNGAIFNVYVENCTTTGFPTGLNSGSDLYNIKDGGLAYTNLVVDGELVNRAGGYTKHATHPNIWVKDNNYYVFDKAGLADLNAYFAANSMNNVLWSREYHIAADIDAAGYTWDSVFVIVGNNANNGFVLDGNGHTISNLTINGSFFTGTPNGGNAGTTPGYIKDLTIDKATVTGDHWTAVFWGNSYGEIVYENVTVKNTLVTGNCNTAVFLGGTVYEDGKGVDNILFKNCKVENCSVVANGKDGQDPTGASVFCGRAYGKTKLTFEGNTIDEATTVINNNGLVGGKVYGYTTWYGDGFTGTGACDTFTNWNGIATVNTADALTTALKASQAVVLTDNITVIENWDARNTGGKTSNPVVIDGNGKTLKFTNSVIDNNYFAVFRFEAEAVVKNLTIDLSESTNETQLRAISCKSFLSVDNCKFIGKANVNSRGIIFGEGAGSNLGFNVSITNSEFTNWKRGVTDNENGQDIKSVTVENNTFNNASVNLSAYDSIVFNKNIMTNSYVDLRTYTPSSTVNVTAQENTLDSAYSEKNIIKNCNPANIDAQDGFTIE